MVGSCDFGDCTALRQTCPNNNVASAPFCNILVVQQDGSAAGKVNDCNPGGGFAQINLQFTPLPENSSEVGGWAGLIFFRSFSCWGHDSHFRIFTHHLPGTLIMFRQHTEILHREIGGPEADPHCNKLHKSC